MQQQARRIETNQTEIHKNLAKVVGRHLDTPTQKPLSEHTIQAFDYFMQWLGNGREPIILDSCCGVGESTANIAQAHPDARVVGVDKSALRTSKHKAYSVDASNYLIVRGDLNDFLRLLVLENISLQKHYLLYPNPYPKPAHFKRRWYATTALPDIIKLGGLLEVRSNWQLYIQEFAYALSIAKINSETRVYNSKPAITPFERKYWQSGQDSWQLITNLSDFI